MADITIDETITQFAERVYPIVLKLQYFELLQQQMYDAFDSYKGDAIKEIDEHSQKQMYQLKTMCKGYLSLAESLLSIVKAFQGQDEESKRKMNDFYIKTLSGIDETKLNAVIASFEG